MPFTLSHPAVVIALPKHQYLHKPALIIGSLSPDFIYYLYGSPTHGVGHSLLGTLYFNLPLCMIFYTCYLWLIAPYFWQYLPQLICPQINETNPFINLTTTTIFATSAIIGSFSHIIWDMFTHKSSHLVQYFSILHNEFHQIPIYKILQHTSSILGLLIIITYLLYFTKNNCNHSSSINLKEKLSYWAYVICIAIIALSIWQWVDPINTLKYHSIVVMIVRMTDVILIGLCLTGLIYTMRKTNQKNE